MHEKLSDNDILSQAHERANKAIGNSLVDKTLFELKDQEQVFLKRRPHWELESIITQQRLRRMKR